MGVGISPNHATRSVLLQAGSQEARTHIAVSLSPDEARRIAADLNFWATAVEPSDARTNVGTVLSVNGRAPS